MGNEKVEKIKELARIEFKLKNIVNAMSQMNMATGTPEEREQAYVDYAIARYNHGVASNNLENEIQDNKNNT